jgi:hypothetical protein
MNLPGRRCSCGSRRRTLRRLVRRSFRSVLAGMAWSGVGHASCTARQLAAVGQWQAGYAVQAPCCPRGLAPLGEPYSFR